VSRATAAAPRPSLLLARSRALALPRRRRDWLSVAAAAVLGVALSNGLSVLALRHIASNQAALINAMVLAATLCWALATTVMRESQSECDPLVFTACYLLLGGALLAGIGLAGGDALQWTWSPRGLAALVFLALFSSTFGFVAYSYLLLHETPSRLGTYAYVNPLVAVIVGWLLLGERLDTRQVLGAGIILAGVMLVRNVPLIPRGAGFRRHL
jgi:drug/metabolite transporter (DMT)-like permease